MNRYCRMWMMGMVLLAVLTACGADSDMWATEMQDDISRSALRVLHFVPADESEYPRQEATFNSPVAASPSFVATTAGGVWDSGRYRLQRGVRVSGKVYTTEGSSIEARVRLTGVIDGVHAEGLSLRSGEVMTKSDSSYDLTLVPGTYIADTIPVRSSWPAQRKRLSISADQTETELVLQPGVEYSGIVSDSAGQPLKGIPVRVISEGGDLRSHTVATGPEGDYRVAVGPDSEQRYRIEFAPAQSDALPRVIFDGLRATEDQSMNIMYEPVTRTTVSGTVKTPQGIPAADVSVVFTTAPSSSIAAATRVETGQTNSEGHVSIQTSTNAQGYFETQVPQGDWSYTFRLQPNIKQPFGSLTISDFDLSKSAREYELPVKVVVQGQVTNEQEQPVSADVVIRKSLPLHEPHQILRLPTNEEGIFTAELDPSAAFFDVTVTPHDGKSARCNRAAVSLPRFQEPFVVPAGVKTEGFVADENGLPLHRVAVTLMELSTSGRITTLAASDGSTDPEGRFTLLLPPEGSNDCRLQ